MIISWINAKGETSMGKLSDNMEQKFIEFCINNQMKALLPEEMKIYYPTGKVQPRQETKTLPVTKPMKKHFWSR